MQIILPSTLRQRIIDQLEASYPNEAGGFLLGHLNDDRASIADTVAIDNVFAIEERHHRYAMTPQDWMRLEDEADARGLSLLGYYHSHPDSPAIPSEYDREHALPNFVYIITAVMMARAGEMRAWQLRPDRSAFDEQDLNAPAS